MLTDEHPKYPGIVLDDTEPDYDEPTTRYTVPPPEVQRYAEHSVDDEPTSRYTASQFGDLHCPDRSADEEERSSQPARPDLPPCCHTPAERTPEFSQVTEAEAEPHPPVGTLIHCRTSSGSGPSPDRTLSADPIRSPGPIPRGKAARPAVGKDSATEIEPATESGLRPARSSAAKDLTGAAAAVSAGSPAYCLGRFGAGLSAGLRTRMQDASESEGRQAVLLFLIGLAFGVLVVLIWQVA